jgi:hypothetical protein
MMKKKYTATGRPLRKGNILEIEKRKQYIAHWRELNMEAFTDLSQDRLHNEWMEVLISDVFTNSNFVSFIS